MEEGETYKNRHNGMYIHIKEITYYNDGGNNPASIVASDECSFESDSKTTVRRQIINPHDFSKLYEEEEEWNLGEKKGDNSYGSGFVTLDIKKFIHKVKEDKIKKEELQLSGSSDSYIAGMEYILYRMDKRAGKL